MNAGCKIKELEKMQSASKVDCPFVKYKSPSKSPGTFCKISPAGKLIDLSVIIPTSDAFRNGYFPKLIRQIESQRKTNYEIIIVKGDPRQGRAINIGAAIAKGKYLLTLDDDSSIPDKETFCKLVKVMEAYPDIGIAGGNNTIPDMATPFIRRVMQEIPRRSWDPVRKITDSDLAEHPCMIMRTKEFKAVGGENELIPRGLDPYLREEFRIAGKRVVIVPGVVYHHLPPDNFSKLIGQFYRNGRQAAFVNIHYPQWVIETPNYHSAEFPSRRPFVFRVIRHAVKMARKVYSKHWVYVVLTLSYFIGYSRGLMTARRAFRA